RIELVVVTAGASNRESKEAAAQSIHAVIQFIGDRLAIVDRTQSEEAEGSQAFRAIGAIDEVTGDLLGDKAVVGLVLVERPDNPVAIAEAVRVLSSLEGVRLVFAVAGHVEPVPCPALSVVRRSQQAIDY